MSFNSIAQIKSYDDLIISLDEFNKKNLPEKIYVHTDKHSYLAGEILWYKLYYVDGYLHRPLQLSRVAYVELIDPSQQSIFKAKVSLDSSESNGSIHIPLNLSSGIYQLKVYTNYMKNFGESLLFEKQIAIYNTFSNDTAIHSFSQNEFDLNIYPEGGNLIAGNENVIAFQLVNEVGAGVSSHIWLVKNGSDTLNSIQTNSRGMQKLKFTPQANQQYHLIARLPNGEYLIKRIEGIENTGTNLILEEKINQLEITVHNNSSQNSFRTRLVFLLATSNRVPYRELKSNFQNGSVQFNFPLDELKEGLTVFTVFNDSGIPLAERLFFKPPSQKLDFAVKLNNESFDTRSLVHLNIQAPNGEKVNSSLSIYRIDSLYNIDESDIYEYLWLTSELKGVVDNPSDLIRNISNNKIDLDLMMLVNGWRRFNWQDFREGKNWDIYEPEVVGQVISGTLKNKITGESVPNRLVAYSVPGKYYKYGVANTDSLGNFSFILKDIYGLKEIYLQALESADLSYEFVIRENYLEHHQPKFSRKFSYNTANQLPQLQEYHLSNQVLNIYYGEQIRQYNILKQIDTMTFYQKPMYSYPLDNYVRFNTFEEVLREFVAPVNVYQKNRNLRISVINTLTREVNREQNLVLVDGLQVEDNSQIFALDPLKFEKVEVISRSYITGNGYFKGIVNFKSYEGDLGGYIAPEKVNILSYEGLQEYRTFYHPQYQTKEAVSSRKPDFRHTMYWNPNIQIPTNGEVNLSIYTSDLKGKYLGVIQGLDKDGKAGSYKFTIEVK